MAWMKTLITAKLGETTYTKNDYPILRLTTDLVDRSGEYPEKKEGKETGNMLPWSHTRVRVSNTKLDANGDPQQAVKTTKDGRQYSVKKEEVCFLTVAQFIDLQSIDTTQLEIPDEDSDE